jgi:hypothetical protein
MILYKKRTPELGVLFFINALQKIELHNRHDHY